MLQVKFMSNPCDITLWWMPQNTYDDKLTLGQVMAWCRQAASYYLSQCWPRSMLPYGITRQAAMSKYGLENLSEMWTMVLDNQSLI